MADMILTFLCTTRAHDDNGASGNDGPVGSGGQMRQPVARPNHVRAENLASFILEKVKSIAQTICNRIERRCVGASPRRIP
jgi:hypothetical protein